MRLLPQDAVVIDNNVTVMCCHKRSVSELGQPCDKSDIFVKLVASCQRDKLFQIVINSVQAVRTQFFGLLLFDQVI